MDQRTVFYPDLPLVVASASRESAPDLRARSPRLPDLSCGSSGDGGRETFIFSGNRRRWRAARPLVGAAGLGVGLWLAALGWMLLKAPELPDLGLQASASLPWANAVGQAFQPAKWLGQRREIGANPGKAGWKACPTAFASNIVSTAAAPR